MEKAPETGSIRKADEYLQALPGPVRTTLLELRQAILQAAPQAEELISYRIPTYRYKDPLVHLAAFNDHCSFITVSKSIMEIFKEDLASFKTTGTTIHFSADNPLPEALVKIIVETRIRENEARKAKKNK